MGHNEEKKSAISSVAVLYADTRQGVDFVLIVKSSGRVTA